MRPIISTCRLDIRLKIWIVQDETKWGSIDSLEWFPVVRSKPDEETNDCYNYMIGELTKNFKELKLIKIRV